MKSDPTDLAAVCTGLLIHFVTGREFAEQVSYAYRRYQLVKACGAHAQIAIERVDASKIEVNVTFHSPGWALP